MVLLFNIAIWVIVIVIIYIFFYFVYGLIKKKKVRSMIPRALILLVCITLLAFFYWPVRLKLPAPEQIKIVVDADSRFLAMQELENAEHILELKELLERQTFIRSTDKTIFGIPSYPSEKGIHLFIRGKDSSYYRLLFARKDANQYSFLSTGEQYYSIKDPGQFVEDLFESIERIGLAEDK